MSSGDQESTSAPARVDELRKAEILRLRSQPWVWIPLISVPVLTTALFLLQVGPGAALISLLVSGLVGLGVIYAVASKRAQSSFYDLYCQSHGLIRHPDPSTGGMTPLLRRGEESRTDEALVGELAPGIEGALIFWTYTEVSQDQKGRRTENDYPFTLIHIEIPEAARHLQGLRVDRAGFSFLDGLQDKLIGDFRRLQLESQALDDRFEIFVDKGSDPVWIHRLFAPSFIVWLTESPPDVFAFQFEGGNLIAYLPGYLEDGASLEAFSAAGAEVATRLAETARATRA